MRNKRSVRIYETDNGIVLYKGRQWVYCDEVGELIASSMGEDLPSLYPDQVWVHHEEAIIEEVVQYNLGDPLREDHLNAGIEAALDTVGWGVAV